MDRDRPTDVGGASDVAREGRPARVRRIEGVTTFAATDETVGGRAARRYAFAQVGGPAGEGGLTPSALAVRTVVAVEGGSADVTTVVPGASPDPSPISSWVVTATDGQAREVLVTDASDLDHLAQAWIDLAVRAEAASGVHDVCIVVRAAGGAVVASAVVAQLAPAPSWAADAAGARAYRHDEGACRACVAVSLPRPPGIGLVHDGTCFGALVSLGRAGEPGDHSPDAAWIVPWAHVSTFAALTEDERADLARAIAAALRAVAGDGREWRLVLRQAPVGDDSGDVHAVGRWSPREVSDARWWPWTYLESGDAGGAPAWPGRQEGRGDGE